MGAINAPVKGACLILWVRIPAAQLSDRLAPQARSRHDAVNAQPHCISTMMVYESYNSKAL